MADTIHFTLKENHEKEIRKAFLEAYSALQEKGYNATSQLVGYVLSGDPTYITTHKNARNLIRSIERDELLQILIDYYIK